MSGDIRRTFFIGGGTGLKIGPAVGIGVAEPADMGLRIRPAQIHTEQRSLVAEIVDRLDQVVVGVAGVGRQSVVFLSQEELQLPGIGGPEPENFPAVLDLGGGRHGGVVIGGGPVAGKAQGHKAQP